MASENTQYFSAVWEYDNSAGDFVDNTLEAGSAQGTPFPILADSADYTYLGLQSKFDFALFMLQQTSSIGAVTWEFPTAVGTWKRFNPGWSELAMNMDPDEATGPYAFDEDGAETFDNLASWAAVTLTTSAPHTATSVPDSVARYYVRFSAASVSQNPTVKRIYCRPKAAYITSTELYDFLMLNFTAGDFTSATTLSTVSRLSLTTSLRRLGDHISR